MDSQANKDAGEERAMLKCCYSNNVIKSKMSKREFLENIYHFLEKAEHQEKFIVLKFENHVIIDEQGRDTNFQKKATAFEQLEKYAYNLLRARWKKTYRVIKENTGFYKCRLEPHLKNIDVIWQQMGYRRDVASWVLDREIPQSDLSELAVDLLIASVECKFLQELYDKLNKCQLGNPAKLAFEIRTNFQGTVEECYLWSMFKSQQKANYRHLVADTAESAPVNVVYDDDDDDLYSPSPLNLSRKGALTQDEHIEASLIAVLSDSQTENKPKPDRMSPVEVQIRAPPPPPERTDSSYRYLSKPTRMSGTKDDSSENRVQPMLQSVSRHSGSSGYASLPYYPSSLSKIPEKSSGDIKPRKYSSPESPSEGKPRKYSSPDENLYTPYENLPTRSDYSKLTRSKIVQNIPSHPTDKYSGSEISGNVRATRTDLSARKDDNVGIVRKKVDSKSYEISHKSDVQTSSKPSNIHSSVKGSQTHRLTTLSGINQWTCRYCLKYNPITETKCRNCSQPKSFGESGSSSGSNKARVDEGKKQIPAVTAEKEIKIGFWECPHCTSVNGPSSNICEVCDKSKDFTNPESSSKNVGKVCKQCTYVNSKGARYCHACKRVLPSSAVTGSETSV